METYGNCECAFYTLIRPNQKQLPFFRKRYQFPVRNNTKWLKNDKLRRAILSAFYNISQRNFGILLILWCSFKLWWNCCLDLSTRQKTIRLLQCWWKQDWTMLCCPHCSQLSTILNNTVTHDSGSTILFDIVDKCEQRGQQNIVQSCWAAGSAFFCRVDQNFVH
jgi:hypothetical protein